MNIQIRRLSIFDIAFIQKLTADPNVRRYSRHRDFKQLKQDLKSQKWVITANEIKVGAIRVYKGEISIAIFTTYHRLGIAYNSLRQLPKGKYWCQLERGNIASWKLFEKLGFVYTGNIEETQHYKGVI